MEFQRRYLRNAWTEPKICSRRIKTWVKTRLALLNEARSLWKIFSRRSHLRPLHHPFLSSPPSGSSGVRRYACFPTSFPKCRHLWGLVSWLGWPGTSGCPRYSRRRRGSDRRPFWGRMSALACWTRSPWNLSRIGKDRCGKKGAKQRLRVNSFNGSEKEKPQNMTPSDPIKHWIRPD